MSEQVRAETITSEYLNRLEGASDAYWVEVENGEIIRVERDVTWLHTLIIQNLFRILDHFVRETKAGMVFIDGNRYILEGKNEEVQRAYKPDLSFLRAGRIPADFDWQGDFEGSPDLALEVASPGQTTTILVGKISDYLRSGTEESWLIIPWRKELHQYRRDADAPRIFSEGDTFTPEGLFPGLTIQINTLFETGI